MAFLESLSFGKEARGNGEKRRIIGTNFACETVVLLQPTTAADNKIKIFSVIDSNRK